MGGITNPVHLMFIAIIALIVLGPKRLPDLARSLGSGMREFRDSLTSATSADEPGLPAVGETTVHASPAPAAPAEAVPAPAPAVQGPAPAPHLAPAHPPGPAPHPAPAHPPGPAPPPA